MAHFAQLDENNVVIDVIVIDNSVTHSHTIANGDESEERGITFCKQLRGEDTRWVQTSYNRKFRKHFAQLGYTYSEGLDAFIPPCPVTGYILNNATCEWECPVAPPDTVNNYLWNGTEYVLDESVVLMRTPVAYLNPFTNEPGPNNPF